MASEMSTTRELGGSLPVNNVQELASKKLKEIPDRYIIPELQSEVVSADESIQVPVIDLRKLLDQQFSSDEMVKLHSACQEWGFFQLKNHGVPEEVIENMKMDLQNFFRLPLEEKKVYSQIPKHIEGFGQAFVFTEEQKLDWADMLYLLPAPVNERNMRFWPKNPTSFRETFDKYTLELRRLAVCLIGFMAKNLGVEPEKLTSMFENGSQGVRMNYYPPCPDANKVIGLSPHSDPTGITLLTQVNQVEGLQIRKNGIWVPIKPIQGAFIVNIGDVLEILSNGNYKSIEHRAVVHPEKERLSMAAFHGPNFDSVIGPLSELTKEGGELFKTMNHEDYIKRLYASKLEIDESKEIPAIDLSRLLDQQVVSDEMAKFHSACRDRGLFKLVVLCFRDILVSPIHAVPALGRARIRYNMHIHYVAQ